MINKIPAAKNLNDYEYEILLRAHDRHTKAMGTEDRRIYALSNIVKVDKNFDEKCLNVYYNTGEWWHYSPKGEWW